MIDLLYLAKPKYGGWVSLTAHLSLLRKYPIYKITKTTQTRNRDFGYGATYQNINIETLKNSYSDDYVPLITCIDKHFYHILPHICDNTKIIIHDPTELKPELLKYLPNFHIIVIRKSMKKLLKEKYNLESEFKYHPFFPFDKNQEEPTKDGAISISRVDFDKNTHIIVNTNDKLSIPIEIYGSCNDLYVYHKLRNTKFKEYYKGRFSKCFNELSNLLLNKKFMVDMSSIKNDGGGTQYTFLEAIYLDCILVLNEKWVNNIESIFIDKYNCYVVKDDEELKNILEDNDTTLNNSIIENSKKILQNNLSEDWIY